jgi:hypothetical protein
MLIFHFSSAGWVQFSSTSGYCKKRNPAPSAAMTKKRAKASAMVPLIARTCPGRVEIVIRFDSDSSAFRMAAFYDWIVGRCSRRVRLKAFRSRFAAPPLALIDLEPKFLRLCLTFPRESLSEAHSGDHWRRNLVYGLRLFFSDRMFGILIPFAIVVKDEEFRCY